MKIQTITFDEHVWEMDLRKFGRILKFAEIARPVGGRIVKAYKVTFAG